MLKSLFHRAEWPQIIGVLGLLCIFSLQLVHSARITSATWDEPHHLFDGYTIWKKHDYRLNPEVPPLIKLTAAAPLLTRSLEVPPNIGRAVPTEAFLDGRRFVFGNGGDAILFPARVACMIFSLVLAGLVYVVAKEMFSPLAGLFALALIVFDPNFLAHGALVTTDVGSSCCFLAAIYSFYRYCRKPTAIRLILAGIATGLLLAAKYTGIFVFPMLLLVALLDWTLSGKRAIPWRRLTALVLMGIMGWLVVWSFYGFRYKAAAAGQDLNPPLTTYLTEMYDQRSASGLRFAASYHLLPEAYIWGLENTKNTEYEDTSYFEGRVNRHGDVRYFPVAFLIKSTLPFLLLLFSIPLAWKQLGLNKALETGFLLIPVIVYFAISIFSHMDIGLRHLLPIYPFLYILLAGATITLLKRNWLGNGVVAILFCWHVASSLNVSPAYMAYGNEAWGGASKVHLYLSDANTDWGQQLKDVKAYLAEHRISDCWFAYFPDGAIEPSDYGISCKRLPTTDSLWWLNLPMSVPPTITGTVLISDSDLEGIEFGDGELNPYESFRSIKPVTAIQHGVYVYHGSFPVPLAAALVEARDAETLWAVGRHEEALKKAEDAAELAPRSAKVRATLGDLLIDNGDHKSGVAQYQAALALTQEIRPDLQEDLEKRLRRKIAKLQTP